MGNPTLYDDDILLWSEQQAGIIRSLKERARDLPNDLDLENIAEEVETVGRSELAAAESLLRQVFVHLSKAAAIPAEEPVQKHWRSEARVFQADFRRRFSPSMAQRISLNEIWREAVEIASDALEASGAEPPSLPAQCPFTFQELLAPSTEIPDQVARLRKLLFPSQAKCS